MRDRVAEIKKKGFNMELERDVAQSYHPTDFSQIKVGLKTLKDAIVIDNRFSRINPRLGNKEEIIRAIDNCDYKTMREVSNFFFRTSGIYSRLCRYMAYLYRYDWVVTPYVNSEKLKDTKACREAFDKVLLYLDNFGVKRVLGDIALKVIRNGCYYGYVIRRSDRADIQELDPNYCRTRFSINNRPVIEFNMAYFDKLYGDLTYRMKILKLYPEEFQKAYKLYKQGKLPKDFIGDTAGWYVLDPGCAIKFNINGEDSPFFMSTIPAIIDLDDARDVDKKKMQQQLLKIIIQKMPIDKNGDLVFDVDEAQALHNNAVRMLARAIGIDVLTTFADVDVASMSDTSSTTAADDAMARTKSAVFDEGGVSQLQFNTDGNIALEKSILNDEAALYPLIQQFEAFLNFLIEPFNKSPKKIRFIAQILPSTIYNYKELAKLYKEQTQLGYSKMFPQIVLGQAQSAILATAYFENEVLDLVNVFIPPLMSSTMNQDILNKNKPGGLNPGKAGESAEGPGRKALDNDKKSEKTIKNLESQN